MPTKNVGFRKKNIYIYKSLFVEIDSYTNKNKIKSNQIKLKIHMVHKYSEEMYNAPCKFHNVLTFSFVSNAFVRLLTRVENRSKLKYAKHSFAVSILLVLKIFIVVLVQIKSNDLS